MAKRRTTTTSRRSGGTLNELRKQAQVAFKQLQRAGRRQISAIERQIHKLNRQRQTLLEELASAIAGGRGRGRAAAGRRRGGRSRTDWDGVFSKLPKGPFRASDVRAFVPGVAAGTLSQRLTAWVKEKKLRRTGSRRGTRYTKG
jgi:hypothetical protein